MSSPELLETAILTPEKTKEKRGEVEKLTANPPRSLARTEKERGRPGARCDGGFVGEIHNLGYDCG